MVKNNESKIIEEKDVDTVLADDIDFSGTMKFKKSLMIKGKFDGRIDADGHLILGPNAIVKAAIKAGVVTNYGKIIGNVEAIQKIEAYKPVNAPDQLITRYFTEDVPTGLVPISSLGAFLNVQTPTIESIIYLTSLLCGMEFKKIGRTIQKLELYDYFVDHLNNIRIREQEKEGIFSIEKILSNLHDFKVCSHCEKINYHKNKICWLCHLKDFRPANENDMIELQNDKEKSLMRA